MRFGRDLRCTSLTPCALFACACADRTLAVLAPRIYNTKPLIGKPPSIDGH
jgi:hypothetical protein